MAQPPPCWISYRQCIATEPAPAPERDWYGCRECGQPYRDHRARSDPSELQREKEELALWHAGSNARTSCFSNVAPVRVPTLRRRSIR